MQAPPTRTPETPQGPPEQAALHDEAENATKTHIKAQPTGNFVMQRSALTGPIGIGHHRL